MQLKSEERYITTLLHNHLAPYIDERVVKSIAYSRFISSSHKSALPINVSIQLLIKLL